MSSEVSKPVSMYRVEHRIEHGYHMHSVRVFSDVRVSSIEDRIAGCTTENYSAATASQVSQFRAEYEAMRDAGVTHLLDPSYYATWIDAVFQQYEAATETTPATYCEANIELPDSPSKIAGAAKLLHALESRMARIDRWHRWQSLDVAIGAAERLCDYRVELYRYRSAAGFERTEYVMRTPVEPAPAGWSHAG